MGTEYSTWSDVKARGRKLDPRTDAERASAKEAARLEASNECVDAGNMARTQGGVDT
jgi:hypothetical protein